MSQQQLHGAALRLGFDGFMHRLRAPWVALALACSGSLVCSPVMAWNDFGHMTVAAVAWQHLRPAARTRVSQLLRLNPDYARWIDGVATQDRDVTAFLRAATWPDAIKHEPGHLDDGESPAGPDANLNIGYEDLREHRYWHYVDVPFSTDGTPVPPVPAPNAATRIADFRQVLADPRAPALLKSYDLTWLLHLVGDIHQPLHAVSRFTQELPLGDVGGNRVRLCAPPCRRELHFFWDQALGRGTPEQAVALARHLPTPAPRRVADTAIGAWVEESGELARRVAYASPIGPGSGPYALTDAYRDQARIIAGERVALAGRRLAVLLNGALAAGGSPRVLPGSGSPP
ncbi:MAG TPA: S1/P1 nuclease [Steroidobacteraceae bacterium]|nr:S1/P1 nuclease [Steroidobacteraceae bacterium]